MTDEEIASFVPRIRRGPDRRWDWAIQLIPGRWQKTSGFHLHVVDETEVTGPGWYELQVADPFTKGCGEGA
jgi:hypothetical protein